MQQPLVAALVAALIVITLNLHYVLLGRPVLEGLLTSRPVLALGNGLFGVGVRQAMTKEGVPVPDRTEVYARGLPIDIYEPEAREDGGRKRPAVLYFHSGAFIGGHRSMGAGMCGWLASHGAVCLSASYRRTGSGAGVVGCLEDAREAFRWLRANAERLGVDASRIVVAGDSAGGLLASALATGLDPQREAPVATAELPAAMLGGWPVTALGVSAYIPRRAEDGVRWEPTPAGNELPVRNAFVPEKHGGSAEATQSRLRTVFAGGFLCFGRRLFGLLPAAYAPAPAVDAAAAAVSPLRLAERAGLPPMLLLTGGADQIVPCDQTRCFAEAAQAVGNEVAQLVFDGAVHGGGGVNCAAGREATLAFLRHHQLLPSAAQLGRAAEDDADDPRDAIGGAARAFSLKCDEYEPVRFRPAVHARATLRVRPVKA
eukprot:Transcript_27223.p1 GENE.Transcript_27223~~Transcript_27223.p1  ORF type:complete len:429 (+),score=167.22 Transcript_27223:213-1499(+)